VCPGQEQNRTDAFLGDHLPADLQRLFVIWHDDREEFVEPSVETLRASLGRIGRGQETGRERMVAPFRSIDSR